MEHPSFYEIRTNQSHVNSVVPVHLIKPCVIQYYTIILYGEIANHSSLYPSRCLTYLKFGKETFVVSDDGEFRRRIIRAVVNPHKPGDARYRHDVTVIVFLHVLQEGFCNL
jgi:hypothetical protein